jgi:hypothetical protein
MCFVEPVTAQSISAYWINSSEALFSGENARGQIGDIMMENDRVAFVISDISHIIRYTRTGGNILDAGSSADRIDALAEIYTFFNDIWRSHTVYDTLAIINDGSGGGSAIVQASGAWSDDPLLLVTTDYSLAADADFLKTKTTVTYTGTGTYTDFAMGNNIRWGNSQKYAPGYGYAFYGQTAEPWIASTTGQVSYGYLSPDTTMLWGPNGEGWSDVNVTTCDLNPGSSCAYTSYFLVGGADIASVATMIHAINEIAVGSLQCTVTSQADGEPIAGASIDVFDNLDLPYLQMVTDASGSAFSTLPQGDWTAQASAGGYVTTDTVLSVYMDAALNCNFVLDADTTGSDRGIFRIGDTLTVIQRPLLNIPSIVRPGDVLTVECEADPSTTGWTVALQRGSLQVPLAVQSSAYDHATLWWELHAAVPEVEVYELYDLVVTADDGIGDTTSNAVQVIPEFKDDYYFIHITDTHLPSAAYVYEYGADVDSTQSIYLRHVIEDINIINPEFVLLTGDFIDLCELEDFLNRRYHSRAQRMLTEFQVPVFLVSGNHDIGGVPALLPPAGTAHHNWWKFFGWKRLNDPPLGAPWYTQNYSFNYGPVHYIGMESYDNYDLWRPDIYGNLSFTTGQLQWLTDDLASTVDDSARVLFYHYDFSQQIDLAALGVEMALWGHYHNDVGDIAIQPYNLSTRNVSYGECAYRLVRVSDGILQPTETVSAEYDGSGLQVDFQPANDGSNYSVTAQIENSIDERFEHSQLQVLMPNTEGSVTVSGGTLIQIDESDSLAVCYIGVDILPSSSQTVTITLDMESSLTNIQGLPVAFALHQNYPNPFNPISTIRYDLPQATYVSLIVYDVLGREVARLVDSYKEPGYHQVQWDSRDASGREVPSGICVARLVTPEYTKSIKMVLLK